MASVFVEPDCGNAPKKLFIRDFMTALAEHDGAAVLACLSDDVEWNRVGNAQLDGKAAVHGALATVMGETIDEMTL